MSKSEDQRDAAAKAFLARQNYQRMQVTKQPPDQGAAGTQFGRGQLTQTVKNVNGGTVFMLGDVSEDLAMKIVAQAMTTR